jgi:hypothetical protein
LFKKREKALISQLTHPLFPQPPNHPPVTLQLSSARALGALIDVCAGRMYRWKGAIIEAVGKCWITLLDSERVDERGCSSQTNFAAAKSLLCARRAKRHAAGRVCETRPGMPLRGAGRSQTRFFLAVEEG